MLSATSRVLTSFVQHLTTEGIFGIGNIENCERASNHGMSSELRKRSVGKGSAIRCYSSWRGWKRRADSPAEEQVGVAAASGRSLRFLRRIDLVHARRATKLQNPSLKGPYLHTV